MRHEELASITARRTLMPRCNTSLSMVTSNPTTSSGARLTWSRRRRWRGWRRSRYSQQWFHPSLDLGDPLHSAWHPCGDQGITLRISCADGWTATISRLSGRQVEALLRITGCPGGHPRGVGSHAELEASERPYGDLSSLTQLLKTVTSRIDGGAYLSISVARCLEAGAISGRFSTRADDPGPSHPVSGIWTSRNSPSTTFVNKGKRKGRSY